MIDIIDVYKTHISTASTRQTAALHDIRVDRFLTWISMASSSWIVFLFLSDPRGPPIRIPER